MIPRGPELEGQERVELLPVIAAPALVLGEEARDRLRAKETAPPDRVGSARLADERPERAAEPTPERDTEALLRPREDLSREHAGESALEDVFRREAI